VTVRSEKTGTLSALIVRAIAMGAAVRGISPPELCAHFDIDPSLLADVDGRVSVALVVKLWNDVPALVGDRRHGAVVTYLLGAPRA
jgi:hypothetical protein